MEPLEKFSISLIKTHYYFLTIQMVMTLILVCINRDERNILLGVETISVIWKVERYAFWAAFLCPSRFRLYLSHPALCPGRLTFTECITGAPLPLASCQPQPMGDTSRSAGRGCVSLSKTTAISGWPSPTATSLASFYKSCWFSLGNASPSLIGFPYLGHTL